MDILAKEQVEILQKEISLEAIVWFGATWDVNKKEYLSDKDGTIVTDLIARQNEKNTTYYLGLVP